MKQRTTTGVPGPAASRPSNFQVIFLFLVGALVFWGMYRKFLPDGWAQWMEDLPVYTHAVSTWMSGHNPYDASLAPLYFLYPPVFLLVAGAIGHLLPAHWGPVIYVTVNLAAIVALPMVLARYFLRQRWLSPAYALLLFFVSPRFSGVLALQTMNIASTLYCAAFLASVPGLRRNRWQWFYLAVFLAAIVKITFLSLLLLPLLAGRRQWWRSVACGAAVVGTNLLEFAAMPDLYRGYEWSLNQGILASQAYGYGVFGIMQSHFFQRPGMSTIPFAVSGLVALTLTGMLFLLHRQLRKAGWSIEEIAANGHWLALVLAAIVLVNPRVMQYDMDIALFAAFTLWVYGLRSTRLLMWTVLLFLPTPLLPQLVHNPRMQGTYTTVLVFVAFGLAYWRAWQDARADVMGAELLAGVAAGAKAELNDLSIR